MSFPAFKRGLKFKVQIITEEYFDPDCLKFHNIYTVSYAWQDVINDVIKVVCEDGSARYYALRPNVFKYIPEDDLEPAMS